MMRREGEREARRMYRIRERKWTCNPKGETRRDVRLKGDTRKNWREKIVIRRADQCFIVTRCQCYTEANPWRSDEGLWKICLKETKLQEGANCYEDRSKDMLEIDSGWIRSLEGKSLRVIQSSGNRRGGECELTKRTRSNSRRGMRSSPLKRGNERKKGVEK